MLTPAIASRAFSVIPAALVLAAVAAPVVFPAAGGAAALRPALGTTLPAAGRSAGGRRLGPRGILPVSAARILLPLVIALLVNVPIMAGVEIAVAGFGFGAVLIVRTLRPLTR